MAQSQFSPENYDVIVVGAGISGAVMAERCASQGDKKVLVLEKRNHIAGNCFDEKNPHGITVHKYGPHLFHTSNEAVWRYLSCFTDWRNYEHEVVAHIDNKLGPVPFNINSLYVWFPREEALLMEDELLTEYGQDAEVSIMKLRESQSPKLRELAEFVYQKLFVNYTVKQWGVSPESISPEVIARVPVRVNRNNLYFKDKYQAIPAQGYTHLVERILDHPNITTLLNEDVMSVIRLDQASGTIFINNLEFGGAFVYTGMLDELFGFSKGELSYRSLQFKLETIDVEQFQSKTTVNYPNAPELTRITEFKHILQEKSPSTTIVREYPQDYDRYDSAKNIPYYPMFTSDNLKRYDQYKQMAARYSGLIPLGRLAEYRYFDMDDAVANALTVAEKLNLQPSA
jgi:UDP-galactopyranose mutase